MKGDNIIEAYCDICRKPITQGQLKAGMAIVDVRESSGTVGRREYHAHTYHIEDAQRVLKDQNYMKAIGMFVEAMGKKTGTPPMDVAQQIAKEAGLDFKQLELGIKAFYSYASVEMRCRNLKEETDE